MKEQIEQIEAVKAGLAKVEKPSVYIGSAISALNAAKDNLAWHIANAIIQAEEAKAKGTNPPTPGSGATK